MKTMLQTMADRGPSYGLSAELALKSEAKFSLEQAKEAVNWVEQVMSAGGRNFPVLVYSRVHQTQ